MSERVAEVAFGAFLAAFLLTVLTLGLVLFPQSQRTNQMNACVGRGGSYIATTSEVRCDR